MTPNYRLVTAEKVNAAHHAGVRIIPGRLTRPRIRDRMIAAGVDGIITNDPEGLVKHLKTKGLR